MSKRALLQTFGLKWNPFARDLPTEALIVTPRLEDFVWRVEQLIGEGGFALITGDSGTGKSAATRVLHHRLDQVRDVTIARIDRPQSSVADFYRELGDAFGISVPSSNRWGGFRALREKWRATLEGSLVRPVILIDEAQEMSSQVLAELRILSADYFDSRSLLTCVLGGDGRLPDRFKSPDLIPLGSRIRTRLILESMTREEAVESMHALLDRAGNPNVMTDGLVNTLADHCMGNFRALTNLANEVLVEGARRRLDVLDEGLFLDFVEGRKGRSAAVAKKRPRRSSGASA